jgi:hypothetical protein
MIRKIQASFNRSGVEKNKFAGVLEDFVKEIVLKAHPTATMNTIESEIAAVLKRASDWWTKQGALKEHMGRNSTEVLEGDDSTSASKKRKRRKSVSSVSAESPCPRRSRCAFEKTEANVLQEGDDATSDGTDILESDD